MKFENEIKYVDEAFNQRSSFLVLKFNFKIHLTD